MYASDEKGKGKANPGNRVYDRVNRHTDMLIDQVKEQLKQMAKDVRIIIHSYVLCLFGFIEVTKFLSYCFISFHFSTNFLHSVYTRF